MFWVHDKFGNGSVRLVKSMGRSGRWPYPTCLGHHARPTPLSCMGCQIHVGHRARPSCLGHQTRWPILVFRYVQPVSVFEPTRLVWVVSPHCLLYSCLTHLIQYEPMISPVRSILLTILISIPKTHCWKNPLPIFLNPWNGTLHLVCDTFLK